MGKATDMSTGIEWAATDVSVGAPVAPTTKPVAPPAPSPTPHTTAPIAWGSVLPWVGMAVLAGAVAWPYLKPAPPKPDSDANAVAAGKAYAADLPGNYAKGLSAYADAVEKGTPMPDAAKVIHSVQDPLNVIGFETHVKPVLLPLVDKDLEPIDRKMYAAKVRAVAKGVIQ